VGEEAGLGAVAAVDLHEQDRMIAEADRLTPHNRFDVHTLDAPHAATSAQFRQIVDILDRLPECRR
jgi:hypothetical protein